MFRTGVRCGLITGGIVGFIVIAFYINALSPETASWLAIGISLLAIVISFLSVAL